MPLQLEKLSANVWMLRDGSTNILQIDSGTNEVRVNSTFKLGANTLSSTQAGAVTVGVAGGYKIARGEVTLDGGNPTPITTGLATVVACTVTDKRATAPGADPTAFTVDYGGLVDAGVVNVYAWKITAVDNGTLIASTDNDDVISWIAIGT